MDPNEITPIDELTVGGALSPGALENTKVIKDPSKETKDLDPDAEENKVRADDMQSGAKGQIVQEGLGEDPGKNGGQLSARAGAKQATKREKPKHQKAKQHVLSRGNQNVNIGKVVLSTLGRLKEEDSRRESRVQRVYTEAAEQLPPLESLGMLGIPRFEFEGLDDRLRKLEGDNIILISCLDEDIAWASAYAIVERLKISDEQKKLMLICEKNSLEPADLTIDLFLRAESSDKARTLVVVGAAREKGQTFLDSLMVEPPVASNIKMRLGGDHLFLVCIGNPEYLQHRLESERRRFHFDRWEIPFLPTLLKHHFPECHLTLLDDILDQKAKGLWSQSESEFCDEIKRYIRDGRLAEEVERQKKAGVKDHSAGVPFRGDDSIEDTVVYVCTFFPGLVARDFQRVVTLLLENRTTIVTVPSLKATPDGDYQKVQTPIEKELVKIWRTDADRILKDCGLILVTAKDSTRRVDFCDPGLRSKLRDYLEFEQSFYLEKQLERIQEDNVLFDSSQDVTDNVIALAVRMALADPGHFQMSWLVRILSGMSREPEADPDGADATDRETPRSKLEGDRDRTKIVFSSVSGLIRKMLEHSSLKDVVKTFLEDLVREGHHDSVLEIIRQVRFTPEFDFYWIKQLMDRGNEEIRFKAYLYLSNRLRQQESSIYDTLKALHSWLPDPDRDPDNYSPSNESALGLLLEYCLFTTSQFDIKYYGAWPCKYPLLATSGFPSEAGDETIDANLSLLTKWLLHPGIESVLKEGAIALVAALVAEWIVILLGKNLADIEPKVNGDAPGVNTEGEIVLNALIKQLVLNANASQRKELIKHWEELTDYLLFAMDDFEVQSETQRRDLSRRRNWVRELIKRFKTLQRKVQ